MVGACRLSSNSSGEVDTMGDGYAHRLKREAAKASPSRAHRVPATSAALDFAGHGCRRGVIRVGLTCDR